MLSRRPRALLALACLALATGCDKGSEPSQAAEPAPAPAPVSKAEAPSEAPAPETNEKPPKMKVELVETTNPEPGAHALALTFEIEDGWHIYWANPGESGLPTRLRLAGPEGVEFGDVQYPLPETFVAPGNIQSYGYGHRAALFSAVHGAKAGDEITGKASWLVCKSSCIKQNAELQVTLGGTQTSDFDDLRQRVPAAFSGAPASEASWESDARGTKLTLTFQGEAPTGFLPAATDPFILEEQSLEGNTLTLRWRRVAPSAPSGGQGVLVFGTEQQPRPFNLTLDWPPTT